MNYSKQEINKNIEKEILRLDQRLELLIKKSRNYSLIRLFVFISAVLFFLGFYLSNYKTTATVIASILGIVFLVLMHNHSKIEQSIKRFKVYLQLKKEQLSRSELDWDNIPNLDNSIINNPTYIEQDLNITERNGLLQLISIGVSSESVNILREWLSGKSNDKAKIINRQKIIAELKELTHFRTRLLLTSKLSINKNLIKNKITEWLESSSRKKGLKPYTIFLVILVIINIIVIMAWLLGFVNSYYYQFLMFYVFFYFAGYNIIKHIEDVSEFLYDDVRKFSSIFSFIEKYNYGPNKELKNSLAPFLKKESSPSKTLSKINFTIEVLKLRKNPFVWFILTCIVPLDYLLSIRVEKFRESIKTDFPIWLNTWYNLEAYSSFAEFAYLNPIYKFPEIKEDSSLLEAKDLGHPLIRSEQSIKNDFFLKESTVTNIITGSNMSGKSTFLRTVGINILLSYAGSVVDAEKFVVSRINLFSCIKVSDSVVDGISYFYAEVKRLRKIIEDIKTIEGHSLVLIDEIYKGTNNVERIIGSRALIKYFSNEKIYNIVSTHDLELVKIAEDLKNVKNFHFKEMIQDDKMSFDFKLSEGPCPTTNALKIMQLEGLPT